MDYRKPARSVTEQIYLLKKRGLHINDMAVAEKRLAHLNYYRLRAYAIPFERGDAQKHHFVPGTTFEQILNLHDFDERLRQLILEATSKIEISIRAQWAYHFAIRFGPFAYVHPKHNRKRYWLERNLEALEAELQRSKEPFIRHFHETYHELYPPVWMASEIMSFGLFSRWYKSTRPTKVMAAIAEAYALHRNLLPDVVHHIVVVRNICAHHGRIWNRRISQVLSANLEQEPALQDAFAGSHPKKLYRTLVVLTHLYRQVQPDEDWSARLIQLIEQHQVPVHAMGFPEDWRERRLWRDCC